MKCMIAPTCTVGVVLFCLKGSNCSVVISLMKQKPKIIDRKNHAPLCHTAPESSMMRTSSNNGEHGLSTCLSGVHLTCERRKRRRPLVHDVCSSSPPVKNAKRTTRKGQEGIAAMHHMNNTLLVA
eukprot:scaffold1933_cov68-Cylindrotheca_fusiformis.AAC.1